MKNKLYILIVLFLFIGFSCFASNEYVDSFIEKIMYLKDWVMEGNIKTEFEREVESLKSELPGLIVKIKGLLPQK
ncbi:MAG: hypothetical protein MCSN_3010 [Candidatus Microsyncoccus archaeolyticus]|jgi:hypothetical protein|nr:MAG: hypothetical protein MCSN_3010 [Candidatus Parcubacteria bacterium]